MRLSARSRSWFVAMGVLAAAATLEAGKIKVEAHRENVDFSTIKTYMWLPSPPPKTEIAPGVARDPMVVQKELEPTIMQTADRELAAHGWKRVENGADVQIVYYLSHGVGFNASNLGEYYQYATGYALIVSPLISPTDNIKVMEEGTLVIDVVQDRKAIWRGDGEHDHQPRQQRREATENRLRRGEETDRQAAGEVRARTGTRNPGTWNPEPGT